MNPPKKPIKPNKPPLPPPPLKTILNCVYCGQEYPAGTPPSGKDISVLTEHIKVCKEHPIRTLKEENQKLREEKRKLRDCLAGIAEVKDCSKSEIEEMQKIFAAMVTLGQGLPNSQYALDAMNVLLETIE